MACDKNGGHHSWEQGHKEHGCQARSEQHEATSCLSTKQWHGTTAHHSSCNFPGAQACPSAKEQGGAHAGGSSTTRGRAHGGGSTRRRGRTHGGGSTGDRADMELPWHVCHQSPKRTSQECPANSLCTAQPPHPPLAWAHHLPGFESFKRQGRVEARGATAGRRVAAHFGRR